MRNLQGKLGLFFWIAVLAIAALPSCQQSISYPSPTLTSISPGSVVAGQPQFTLTVTGSNFTPASLVEWNGAQLPEYIFVSDSEMQATVTANLIQSPGSASVSIFTPQPGGGLSKPLTLTILEPLTLAPQITSLAPSTVLAGSGVLNLFINGVNFNALSIVTVNGQNRVTTFLGPASLAVQLTAADLTSAGALGIAVVNPQSATQIDCGGPGLGVFEADTDFNGGSEQTTTATIDTSKAANPAPMAIYQMARVGNSTAAVSPVGSVTYTIPGPSPVGSTSTVRLHFAETSMKAAGQRVFNVSINGVQVLGNFDIFKTAGGENIANVQQFSEPTNANGQYVIQFTPITNASYPLISGIEILPPTGGGSSNTVALAILNPLPGLSSLSPASVQAGSGATITVTGTIPGPDFVPNSVVLINGAPHTTVYTSATQVSAALTAADVASAGIDLVQVVNPPSRSSPPFDGGTSNTLTFAITPTISAGLPMLVDIAPNGSQADDGICGGAANCQNGSLGLTLATSGPSESADGSFIAFASVSGNLVTGQTNSSSAIFLASTCLTEISSNCVPGISPVSLAVDGGPANGANSEPTVDSAGDHVAFTSQATNLVTYVSFQSVPPGRRQVYTQPPCTIISSTMPCTFSPSTNGAVLVSISADGTAAGNGDSYNPVISPDGQYVAFTSLATNLVSGISVDGVTPQVYLRYTCGNVTPLTQTAGGCIPTTYLVSSPDGTTPGNAPSSHPAIANDGTYVAFVSSATNLGPDAPNPSGLQEIFEQYDCQIVTSSCTPSMSLISTPDGVTPADAASVEPAISSDGRFIAFASAADNLGIAPGGFQQIFVRDTCLGSTLMGCTASTTLVSTPDALQNPKTPAKGLSEHPSINSCGSGIASTTCITGQFIAFASVASNLAPTQNGVENIFVRNTCDGVVAPAVCTPSTVLTSQASGASPPAADGSSVAPSISGDGHTVSFISFADNLVAHDTNGLEDLFLAATSF
ncbi:MAG: malectin domain-containing carbohydrate-binding protein [Candidatus Acidiferrales bacterium]